MFAEPYWMPPRFSRPYSGFQPKGAIPPGSKACGATTSAANSCGSVDALPHGLGCGGGLSVDRSCGPSRAGSATAVANVVKLDASAIIRATTRRFVSDCFITPPSIGSPSRRDAPVLGGGIVEISPFLCRRAAALSAAGHCVQYPGPG